MKEPVEALGWTLKEFDYDLTKGAQDYVRAVDAALDSKPDYLSFSLGYGSELIAKQLQRAKDEGIPVIGHAGTDNITDLESMTGGPVSLGASGSYAADIAVADAEGPVHMATAVDPTRAGLVAIADGAAKQLKKVPGSAGDKIEVSYAQPQPTNVAAIVNYIKTHSDTRYILFPGTSFYAGVAQGVRAAGLKDKVEFILAFPEPQDLQAIKGGEFLAAIGGETEADAWRQVDGMARLSVGQTIVDKTPIASYRLVNSDNATEDRLEPANFKTAYETAWGL
jgi:ABC-type sugar transport system substrate-binding protein